MNEKRLVEFLHDHKTAEQDFEVGDRKRLPKHKADHYIEIGICKCVETGEENELKPGAHVVKPDSTVQPA